MQKTSHISIPSVTPSKLRTGVMITLLLLAVQFLIGMVVNLYVQVPSVHPGNAGTRIFQWGCTRNGVGFGTWHTSIMDTYCHRTTLSPCFIHPAWTRHCLSPTFLDNHFSARIDGNPRSRVQRGKLPELWT